MVSVVKVGKIGLVGKCVCWLYWCGLKLVAHQGWQQHPFAKPRSFGRAKDNANSPVVFASREQGKQQVPKTKIPTVCRDLIV